jgi:hypothetical protein
MLDINVLEQIWQAKQSQATALNFSNPNAQFKPIERLNQVATA